ncbi:MAG: hypothetical protein ACKOBA_12820, partial [Limnohabitans sp.]
RRPMGVCRRSAWALGASCRFTVDHAGLDVERAGWLAGKLPLLYARCDQGYIAGRRLLACHFRGHARKA